MPFALLIGLGAGLVSAVLFASAATGTMLGLFILFLLSPLPVAIAGLGWGWPTSAVAAAVGAIMVAITGAPRAGVLYVIALGLPTVVLVYLALLNRTVPANPTDSTESPVAWYPLGRVVTAAAVWGGVVAALALLATASDIEGLRAAFRDDLEKFVRAMPMLTVEPAIGENDIAALADFIVPRFADALATAWTALAVLNLWLAGVVTRKSGRLIRPWPDLPSLTLPRSLRSVFALAIALTFVLPGYPGLMASGFASAFMFAFMLVGLAIIHHVTRGNGMRLIILGAVYAALLLFFYYSRFPIALIGVAEPFSPLRRRPPPT